MMDEGDLSAQGSSKESEAKPQSIVVHVLSPSIEVPSRLTFSDIFTSTTVGELKIKIRDVVASRPAPDRQRLIYRGKALIQEGATLKDIFSQETIDQSESLSLHLVLPPSGPTNPSRSSTPLTTRTNVANLNNQRSRWIPPFAADHQSSHQVPLNTAVAPEINSLGSLSQPQSTDPHVDPQNTSLPPLPAPLPPYLQEAMNRHFETMNQRLRALIPPNSNAMPQAGSQNQANHNPSSQPNFIPPNFQSIIVQQQQARAAAELHGMNSDDRSNLMQSGGSSMPNRGISSPLENSTAPSLPANSRVIQENHGPNGEHWRMVIESTQTVTLPHQHNHYHDFQNTQTHRPSSSLSNRSNTASPPMPITTPTPQSIDSSRMIPGDLPVSNPSNGQSLQSRFEQTLSSIETALAGGTAPTVAMFESARTLLHSISSLPDISSSSVSTFRHRLDNLSNQADRLRAGLNNILRRVVSEQPHLRRPAPQTSPFSSQALSLPSSPALIASQSSSQPSQRYLSSSQPSSLPSQPSVPSQSSPTPSSHLLQTLQPPSLPSQHSTIPSQPTSVYLLSSPNGPYALLVSPEGIYTTAGQFPALAGSNQSPLTHRHSHIPYPTQPANPVNESNAQIPPVIGVQDAPAPQQQQQQQQQEQQVNQARDLIRVLLPLGGHIWLLVRLFGFVYFFTGGGGHRRAIFLGIGAFLIFILQTSFFRPMLQSLWEPFRRHMENLLPLANNERHLLPNAAVVEENVNPPQGQDSQFSNVLATPQQTAERLLRQRGQRDGILGRQYLRRAERAIALFLASLIPGVGERHIAARDAAEATRRAEERERARQTQDEDQARHEREMGEESNSNKREGKEGDESNESKSNEMKEREKRDRKGKGREIPESVAGPSHAES